MSNHSPSKPVISTKNLSKAFGSFKALDGLDLTVSKGEVHGFLGPNGAGKSTTIRILLGLLKKSGGTAELFGQDPWDQAVSLHRRLAYVPGDVNLWPNLTGGEAIDVLGNLRGGFNPSRRKELLDRFQLDPTKPCATYSKGNRQKVAIVAALASDVELYILDEPTSGLDPLMQATFDAEIASLKADGKTVLLSSHVLAEVESLCDRITIIKEGRAVETGTLTELRHLTRTTVTAVTEKPVTGLEELEGLTDVKTESNRISLKVEPSHIDALLRHLTRFTVTSLVSSPPTLEELFLKHYGQDNRTAE